jgi:molybdopterin-biosynthesis enzyme MoeA-like protein
MVKEKYETYARKTEAQTIELTKPRIKMATLPEKTEPIRNPVGTAPAVKANVKGTIIIALPGVPSEVEAIFTETVAPLLRQASQGITFHEKSIYADSIMESTLAPLIDTVMKSNRDVYIKSHPRGAENRPCIEIHFYISATESEKPEEKLQTSINQLSSLIAENNGKTFTEKQVIT